MKYHTSISFFIFCSRAIILFHLFFSTVALAANQLKIVNRNRNVKFLPMDSPEFLCTIPPQEPVQRFKVYDKNENLIVQPAENSKYWNVIVRCEHGLVTKNITTVFESFCYSNNEWKPPLNSCGPPTCGLADEVIIEDGMLIKRYTEAPWHVAIYKVSANYHLFCGGTLISPKAVLSAAHCFYDKFKHTIHNQTTDYEVVVAKQTRNFNKTDNASQKNYKVQDILVPEKPYSPYFSGHDGADIILLVLKEPVSLNRYTFPACIDWNIELGFLPRGNVSGTIAGWGADETGRLSQVLKIGKLPYVSIEQCMKHLKYVTPDKFCAGSEDGDGPGVRKGDGGGGLIFKNPSNKLHYIRGIASVRELYLNVSYSTFTDVSYYTNWLRDTNTKIRYFY